MSELEDRAKLAEFKCTLDSRMSKLDVDADAVLAEIDNAVD
jgi:hypothetical protein